ncbi:MAG: DUF1294 domain-containing protein [Ruminiclostridium sp.]|nr:DUF1294 domain-containing protein [Ruminiclostridium sp.]
MTLVLIWVLSWTVITFALMGIDKRKAIRDRRRIPERALFLSAALGGSLGALLGMSLFRHKTKHWSFRLGMPAILVAQVLLAFGISYWRVFLLT